MRGSNLILLAIAGLAAVAVFYREPVGAFVAGGAARIGLDAWLPAKGASPGGGSGGGSGSRGGSGAPVAVQTATARAGSLMLERRTIGTVEPALSVDVASELTGRAVKVAVADGARVRQGDLIVQLDDASIRALVARDVAQVARDRAALASADRAQKRSLQLKQGAAISQQAIEDAETAVETARANLAASEAQQRSDEVTLDKTRITAPFDGVLGEIGIDEGAIVTPGAILTRLTATTPLHVEFALSEADLALAHQAMAGGRLTVAVRPVFSTLSAAETAAAGPGGTLSVVATSTAADPPAVADPPPVADPPAVAEGPVDFIDATVDRASGTFLLRARLTGGDGRLWPGQSVEVTVSAGEVGGLVLVPLVAVAPRGQGAALFVVKDGKAGLRPVTVALRSGNIAGISAGLAAGEEVIVEGQGSLVEGTPVNPVALEAEAAGTGGQATP